MLLHYTDVGSGKPLILLHGMAGSTRYWDTFLPYIQPGRRIIAIDLLGFGHSPMPKHVTYNYKTHMQSIMDTLDHLGISKSFSLIGHSMGALIALRLAATYPQNVQQLMLIAMPVYSSEEQAHQSITGSSRLKELAYYGITSKILCNAWCKYLRPLSSRLAPKYLPHLTEEAAQDSLLHTWQSYAQSLHYIIESQNVRRDIQAYKKPIIFVYGDSDVPAELQKLKPDLNPQSQRLIVLMGTHQVLHQHPRKIATLVH